MGDEENQNGNEGQGNNGHPAWQEILDVLPEEFHGIVKPKLAEWDSGVQERFNGIHNQYDAYKPLLENNVPMTAIEQGLYLAQMAEQDPATLVQQMVDHFNLEQFKASQPGQQQQVNPQAPTPPYTPPSDNFGFEDDPEKPLSLDDLQKDPRFKEFFDQQQKFQSEWEQRKQQEEYEQGQKALEDYLKGLHEEKGDFNDQFVTALMAQGMEGEDAVKQYQDTINAQVQAQLQAAGQQQVSNPPVVMGGSGTTGSGVPQDNVKMGDLSKSALNDLVTQLLEQSQQGG